MFAEWHKQKAIILIYPHIYCDFKDNLESTQDMYDKLIAQILKSQNLILILHPEDHKSKARAQSLIQSLINTNSAQGSCFMLDIASNDVWARDSVGISVNDRARGFVANFIFNAWGGKFDSKLDNAINAKLKDKGIFDNMRDYDFVLEGGSIDYNGEGLLLTNTQCLLNVNRNARLSKEDIERRLKESLHIKEVLWLSKGFLLGDDTDSHIDTLARFIRSDCIAYVKCYDKSDRHYEELESMERELVDLSARYKLTLLPIPFCKYELDSKPLPASYINFLFLNNNRLLVPIYNKPTDNEALNLYQKALPDYDIQGINCEALIRQHGSLHCISMQIH